MEGREADEQEGRGKERERWRRGMLRGRYTVSTRSRNEGRERRRKERRTRARLPSQPLFKARGGCSQELPFRGAWTSSTKADWITAQHGSNVHFARAIAAKTMFPLVGGQLH